MPDTAYHLHGNDLHDQTDAVAHCRQARQRTLVATGRALAACMRIETILDDVFADSGPRSSAMVPSSSLRPGVRTFERGRE